MNDELSRSAVSAAKWAYAGAAMMVVAQLAGSIALARTLGPVALGVFAFAMTVYTPFKVLAEAGLGAALVQRRTLAPDDVAAVLARLTVLAIVAVAAWLAMVYGFAQRLGYAEHRTALALFAVALAFSPVAVVASALLTRAFDQRRVNLYAVAGYLVFLGVSLGGALAGIGPASLAAGFVAQTLVAAALAAYAVRLPMRLRWRSDARELWSFGLRGTSSNLSNWATGSADNLLVWRFHGTEALGLYAVAFGFVRAPVDRLVSTLVGVLLPVAARMQDDPQRLGASVRALLAGVALLTLPAFAGLAVVADTAVAALYGAAWAGAAAPLVPLAAAMPLYALAVAASAVLWGAGGVGREMRVQWLALAVLLVIGVAIGSASAAAVGWAVLAAYAVRAIALGVALARLTRLPVLALVRALRGGVIVAAICATLILVVEAMLVEQGWPAIARFSAALAVGAASWLALVVLGGSFVLAPELRRWVRPLLQRARVRERGA